MGKILLFASLVISLATAGIGFVNKGNFDTAKATAAAEEAKVAQLNNQLKAKEEQIKTVSGDTTALTAEKDQAVAALATAQAELEKAKSSVNDATTAKSTVDAQLTQVQAELDSTKQQLTQAQSAQAAVPTGPSPEQVAELEEKNTVITKLQSDLDSARSQLEVLNKDRQNRLSKTMQNGLEGRILAVNPAWNFVVLSLGDKNGVINNAELIVKRGRQMIGKVRITSVEPSTSIADIVANSMPQGTTISPGDQVIYQAQQD